MVTPVLRDEGQDSGDGWFLTNAIARGVDQSQAMLYATANALGSLTGIDFVARWGEEGMHRNIKEMLENPARIETWDDVDGLASFGMYVLERMGEQIPSMGAQLAAMAAGGAAGTLAGGPAGGAAGAAGARAATMGATATAQKMALAQLGKQVSRKVGPRATQAARKKAAGAIGATGAGYLYSIGEGVGESRMTQLLDENPDADSPVAAIAAGSLKGAIDMIGFERLTGAVRALGRPAEEVVDEAFKRTKKVLGATAVEGFTEGIQTTVDQMMMSGLTGEDRFDFNEVKESAIAGAVVGGGFSTIGAGVGAIRERAAKDSVEPAGPEMRRDNLDAAYDELDAMEAENNAPVAPVDPSEDAVTVASEAAAASGVGSTQQSQNRERAKRAQRARKQAVQTEGNLANITEQDDTLDLEIEELTSRSLVHRATRDENKKKDPLLQTDENVLNGYNDVLTQQQEVDVLLDEISSRQGEDAGQQAEQWVLENMNALNPIENLWTEQESSGAYERFGGAYMDAMTILGEHVDAPPSVATTEFAPVLQSLANRIENERGSDHPALADLATIIPTVSPPTPTVTTQEGVDRARLSTEDAVVHLRSQLGQETEAPQSPERDYLMKLTERGIDAPMEGEPARWADSKVPLDRRQYAQQLNKLDVAPPERWAKPQFPHDDEVALARARVKKTNQEKKAGKKREPKPKAAQANPAAKRVAPTTERPKGLTFEQAMEDRGIALPTGDEGSTTPTWRDSGRPLTRPQYAKILADYEVEDDPNRDWQTFVEPDDAALTKKTPAKKAPAKKAPEKTERFDKRTRNYQQVRKYTKAFKDAGIRLPGKKGLPATWKDTGNHVTEAQWQKVMDDTGVQLPMSFWKPKFTKKKTDGQPKAQHSNPAIQGKIFKDFWSNYGVTLPTNKRDYGVWTDTGNPLTHSQYERIMSENPEIVKPPTWTAPYKGGRAEFAKGPVSDSPQRKTVSKPGAKRARTVPLNQTYENALKHRGMFIADDGQLMWDNTRKTEGKEDKPARPVALESYQKFLSDYEVQEPADQKPLSFQHGEEWKQPPTILEADPTPADRSQAELETDAEALTAEVEQTTSSLPGDLDSITVDPESVENPAPTEAEQEQIDAEAADAAVADSVNETAAVQEQGTTVVPEQADAYAAQFDDMLDPASGRDAMFVSADGVPVAKLSGWLVSNNEAIQRLDLRKKALVDQIKRKRSSKQTTKDEDIALYHLENELERRDVRRKAISVSDDQGRKGTFLTNSEEKYDLLNEFLKINDGVPVNTKQLGLLLYDRPEGKLHTDGRVVSTYDPQTGRSVSDFTTHPDTVERDYQNALDKAAPGQIVTLPSASDAIKWRQDMSQDAIDMLDGVFNADTLSEAGVLDYEIVDNAEAKKRIKQHADVIQTGELDFAHTPEVYNEESQDLAEMDDATAEENVVSEALRDPSTQISAVYMVDPQHNRPFTEESWNPTDEERLVGRGYRTKKEALDVLRTLEETLPRGDVIRHVIRYRFKERSKHSISDNPYNEPVFLVRQTFLPPAFTGVNVIGMKEEVYVPLKLLKTPTVARIKGSKASRDDKPVQPPSIGYGADIAAHAAYKEAKEKGRNIHGNLKKLQKEYASIILEAFQKKVPKERDQRAVVDSVVRTLADDVRTRLDTDPSMTPAERGVHEQTMRMVLTEWQKADDITTLMNFAAVESREGGLLMAILAQRYVPAKVRREHEDKIRDHQRAIIAVAPFAQRGTVTTADRTPRQLELAGMLPTPKKNAPFGHHRKSDAAHGRGYQVEWLYVPSIVTMGRTYLFNIDNTQQTMNIPYESDITAFLTGLTHLFTMGFDLTKPDGPFMLRGEGDDTVARAVRPDLLVKVPKLNEETGEIKSMWQALSIQDIQGNSPAQITTRQQAVYIPRLAAYTNKLVRWAQAGSPSDQKPPPPSIPNFKPTAQQAANGSRRGSLGHRNLLWSDYTTAANEVAALDDARDILKARLEPEGLQKALAKTTEELAETEARVEQEVAAKLQGMDLETAYEVNRPLYQEVKLLQAEVLRLKARKRGLENRLKELAEAEKKAKKQGHKTLAGRTATRNLKGEKVPSRLGRYVNEALKQGNTSFLDIAQMDSDTIKKVLGTIEEARGKASTKSNVSLSLLKKLYPQDPTLELLSGEQTLYHRMVGESEATDEQRDLGAIAAQYEKVEGQLAGQLEYLANHTEVVPAKDMGGGDRDTELLLLTEVGEDDVAPEGDKAAFDKAAAPHREAIQKIEIEFSQQHTEEASRLTSRIEKGEEYIDDLHRQWNAARANTQIPEALKEKGDYAAIRKRLEIAEEDLAYTKREYVGALRKFNSKYREHILALRALEKGSWSALYDRVATDPQRRKELLDQLREYRKPYVDDKDYESTEFIRLSETINLLGLITSADSKLERLSDKTDRLRAADDSGVDANQRDEQEAAAEEKALASSKRPVLLDAEGNKTQSLYSDKPRSDKDELVFDSRASIHPDAVTAFSADDAAALVDLADGILNRLNARVKVQIGTLNSLHKTKATIVLALDPAQPQKDVYMIGGRSYTKKALENLLWRVDKAIDSLNKGRGAPYIINLGDTAAPQPLLLLPDPPAATDLAAVEQVKYEQYVHVAAQTMAIAMENRLLTSEHAASYRRSFFKDKEKFKIPLWEEKDNGFRAWLADRMAGEVTKGLTSKTTVFSMIKGLHLNPKLNKELKDVSKELDWLTAPRETFGIEERANPMIPGSIQESIEKLKPIDLAESLRPEGRAPLVNKPRNMAGAPKAEAVAPTQMPVEVEQVPNPDMARLEAEDRQKTTGYQTAWRSAEEAQASFEREAEVLAEAETPTEAQRRREMVRWIKEQQARGKIPKVPPINLDDQAPEARTLRDFKPADRRAHNIRLRHRLKNVIPDRLPFVRLSDEQVDVKDNQRKENQYINPKTGQFKVQVQVVATTAALRKHADIPQGKKIKNNVAGILVKQPGQGVRTDEDGNEVTFTRAPTIILVADNIEDVDHAARVIRHEVLGHYGVTYFMTKAEKKAFRARVKASNKAFGVKDIFDEVNETYKDLTEDQQLEEVIARIAEYMVTPKDVQPKHIEMWVRLKDAFTKLLRKLGFLDENARSELELRAALGVVAHRMAKRSIWEARKKEGGGREDHLVERPMDWNPYNTPAQAAEAMFGKGQTLGRNIRDYNLALFPDLKKWYNMSFSNVQQKHLPAGQRDNVHAKVRKAFNAAPDVKPFKAFMARGAVLNSIAPSVAKRATHRAQTKMDFESYETGVDRQRSYWMGRLNTLFEKIGMDSPAISERTYYELATEVPYKEKSAEAKAITDLLREYGDYLQSAMHTLELEDNYFPREHMTEEYKQRPDEAIKIFTKHGVDDPAALLDTITRFDQEYKLRSDIVDQPGYMHDRRLDNPELIKALVDAKFIAKEPHVTLLKYMEKTIRRAELERAFGGMAASKYKQMTDKEKLRFKAMTPDEVESMQREYAADWIDKERLANQNEPLTTEEKAFVRRIKARGKLPFFGTARWEADAALEQMIEDDVDPRRADEVRSLTHGIVLNAPLDRTSKTYQILSEVKAFESFRTLLGSGAASVPEVAGVFTRAKGTLDVKEFFQTIHKIATDKQYRGDLEDLARIMGVIRNGQSATLATELTAAEQDPNAKGFFQRHLPKLFEYNGNNFVVKFSRLMALDVGVDFVKAQAGELYKLDLFFDGPLVVDGKINPDLGLSDDALFEAQSSMDWLQELGIDDYRHVVEWVKAGEPRWSPSLSSEINTSAKVVNDGIISFVNEAVLTPKASERPIWMDSLWGQMAGHLKSFMFSYMSVVIGGFAREWSRKIQRGEQMSQEFTAWQHAMPFVMSSMGVFLILGGLTEELRQRIFTFGERGAWDRANEDFGKLMMNVADRTGWTTVPFFDALFHTDRGLGAITFQAGPAAHHLYELQDMLLRDEPQFERALWKSVPIISQLPTVRRGLYDNGEALDYAGAGTQ